MTELRDQVYEIALCAAVSGSLQATDSLADSGDAPPWMVEVLERTESWPVRLRAAELLRNSAYMVVLYKDEKRRALCRLRRLQRDAVGVALGNSEHAETLGREPWREFPDH